jgi:hypothetical protein
VRVHALFTVGALREKLALLTRVVVRTFTFWLVAVWEVNTSNLLFLGYICSGSWLTPLISLFYWLISRCWRLWRSCACRFGLNWTKPLKSFLFQLLRLLLRKDRLLKLELLRWWLLLRGPVFIVALVLGVIPMLIALLKRVVCVLVAITANQLVQVTVYFIVVTLT